MQHFAITTLRVSSHDNEDFGFPINYKSAVWKYFGEKTSQQTKHMPYAHNATMG